MKSLMIRGRGIAAITAAWVLAERGFSVTVAGPSCNRDLQVAIEQDTLKLLEDVFELQLSSLPFAYHLSQRIIRGWHSSPEIVDGDSLSLPLADLVASLEQRLCDRFTGQITWVHEVCQSQCEGIVIHATGRQPADGLTFGRRVATVAEVELSQSTDACVIERTDVGWAFLLPSRAKKASLFAFAANADQSPDDVLDAMPKHGSIGKIVLARQPAQCWRMIAPSLSYPLATETSVLVGEAAFTFDPICGDGVGYAARSALLAATAVADFARGEGRGLQYYEARLLRTFHAHLLACSKVYEGWHAAGWSNESDQTRRGIEFLQNQKPKQIVERIFQ